MREFRRIVTGHDEKGVSVTRNEAIYRARRNLWILDGGIRLVELKNWLGEQPREVRQTVLAQRLIPKEGALDFLIFDCAPGWDVLSVNILMAATEVLCPVALQGPALEGLKTFFGYLMSAQRHNEALELKYVLPTMYDRRTRQSGVIHHKLQKLFRKQICDPIRYNVRLSEAPSKGQSIFEYRRTAAGASDYARLVERITNGARP